MTLPIPLRLASMPKVFAAVWSGHLCKGSSLCFCGSWSMVLLIYCPHNQAIGVITCLLNDDTCRSISRLETSVQGFSVARSGREYGLDYAVFRNTSRTTMAVCSTPNHRSNLWCLELDGDVWAPLSELAVNSGYLAIPPIWRGEGLDFVVF